ESSLCASRAFAAAAALPVRQHGRDEAACRRYQHDAVVRRGVVIALGVRRLGRDLIGHRRQLERARDHLPDLGLQFRRARRGGRALERLDDGAALLVGQRLEGVGGDRLLVVGGILGGELGGHGVGVGRRARRREGAIHERALRRGLRGGRLLLGQRNAGTAD